MADAPLEGATPYAEVSPADPPKPGQLTLTIPAQVQNALLRDLSRGGGALDEQGMHAGAQHVTAFRADVAKFAWPRRLPNEFDRSRVALVAFFELAREWGVPLAVAVDACRAPGWTREEVETIGRSSYAAGFRPPGTKGEALQAELDRAAAVAAEHAQRAERARLAAERRTPIRAVVIEFGEGFNLRTMPDGDVASVWDRMGGPRSIVFDARGLPGPDVDMRLCRGATLREVSDVPMTAAELGSAARLGQFPALLGLIAEARKESLTSARASYAAPDAPTRDELTWRTKLAREALVALRKVGQLVDERGAPTSLALDLGVAVSLSDVEMISILREACPSLTLPALEEAITLRAPVWMPGELLRDPLPDERRALARELGLLHERIGAYLADRVLTTFRDIKNALAGEGIVRPDDDPREAAEIRGALELSGWKQGEQLGGDGRRHRVWRRAESNDAAA